MNLARCGAALMLLCLNAHAADITVEAKLGLGGFSRGGCTAPLRVVVRNHGGDVRGVLSVTRSFYGGGTQRYEVPVVLPGESTFIKTLVVPAAGETYGYAQSVVAFEPESGPTVRCGNVGGAPLGNKRLVVVLGPRGSLGVVHGAKAVEWGVPPYAQDNGGAPPITASLGLPSGLRAPVEVQLISITPEEAPEDWQAYEGADNLVLPGTALAMLSAAQREAVAKWTAAGGWTVITGGTATSVGHDPYLGPLLPARVGGLASVPSLRALNRRYAASASLRDIPLLEAEPTAGSVLLKEGRCPLAVVGTYGLGTVVFLTFDPFSKPFAAWTGAAGLWREMLRLAEPRTKIVATPSEVAESVGQVVEVAAEGRSASLNLVIGFLLAYFLLAIPINRIVLRRLGKTELAWATIPAIAVFFAYGSFVFARGLKGQKILLTRASVVWSGPRSPNALTADGFVLFSPALRAYEVTLPPGVRTLSDVTEVNREEWRKRFGLIFRPVDPPVLRDASVGMWASRKFAFCNVSEQQGGLTCSLDRVEGHDLVGAVSNGGSRPLRDVAFLLGTASAPVGALAPGETRTFRLALDNPTAAPRSISQLSFADGLMSLSAAERTLAAYPGSPGYYEGPRGVHALAWTNGAWAVGFSDRPRAEIRVAKHRCEQTTTTIYASRPQMLLGDGHVLVPPDACGVVITQAPAGSAASHNCVNVRPGRCVLEFSPPLEAREAHWEWAALSVRAEFAPGPVIIDGFDGRARRWTRVGKVYSGVHTALLPDPQRFVDRGSGRLRLALNATTQVQFHDARLALMGSQQ